MARATRHDLFTALDALKIAHETRDHPAFFTVEEGREFKADMPGGHTKNLFLKDKKGAFALAVAWAETPVDLVGLAKALGAKGRFSFARAEALEDILGVTPGSVTPLALINAAPAALAAVVLDDALFQFDQVWVHPLENTASTRLAPGDLAQFVAAQGFAPRRLDLARPLHERAPDP